MKDSFGGLIILKTLIHNEVKIKEVFLVAPAYVVNGNPLKWDLEKQIKRTEAFQREK